MIIALPDNKFHAYSKAISEMLQRGWTSKGDLESNIGRWVHLGQIIPTVHHFHSRLRFLKQRSENRWRKPNLCTVEISTLGTPGIRPDARRVPKARRLIEPCQKMTWHTRHIIWVMWHTRHIIALSQDCSRGLHSYVSARYIDTPMHHFD